MRAYRGFVKVSSVGYSKDALSSKISSFMSKRFLGSYSSEGYGRVTWLECLMKNYSPSSPAHTRRFTIRKGLGVNYPKELQRVLLALMLHDFVLTSKHPSKIYQQINIEDEEIKEACLNHHNGKGSTNPLLPLVKYYDAYASLISRKKPFKTISRYDYEKGEIAFSQIGKEIEQIQHSAYKLYHYIYHSKELARVVESMEYGKNSLQNHLQIMVNLAINDYCNKKLIIAKNKIKINTKKNSLTSANKSENIHQCAMDAEMHSFSDHEQR